MTKDKFLIIRVTEADRQLAKETSFKLFGKRNVSRLFTKMLNKTANNSPIISDESLTDFRMAVSQLSGMARNLNQITRRINSDDAMTGDYLSMKYLNTISIYIQDVNNQIKKIIKDNS